MIHDFIRRTPLTDLDCLVGGVIQADKAVAMRPQIVGLASRRISPDEDISRALFIVLETQNIIENELNVMVVPKNGILRW